MRIINNDCLLAMKEMPDNSVDAIVTDPPYGLSFMGKKWDYDVPSQEIWEECLRVLKPGGYLLSFAGTRTQHRMAVRIEDAGFEIRDMIAWIYGSGFPKSRNIGKDVEKINVGGLKNLKQIGTKQGIKCETGTKGYSYNKEYVAGKCMGGKQISGEIPVYEINNEWEGWGTALKPALETITVARKPLSEKTVAENVLKWGTGGINIDGSRVPTSYNSDDKVSDNTLDTFPSQKLYELRGKLYTLLLSSVADKKDCQSLSSVDGYVQSWKVLQDCLGDCSVCLRLYDVLSPLFLGGDQVPVQQLHDVHDDISRLQQEQSDNPSGQDTDHLSSLGDFSQLVLTYLNDTTPNVESKAPVGRFPANLIHDGSDEVISLFPNTGKGNGGKSYNYAGKEYNNRKTSMFNGDKPKAPSNFNDSGSASRFFYCAKASKRERNIGCEGLETSKKFTAGNYSQSPTCKTCDLTLNGTNDHSECSGEVYYKEMESKNTKNNHPTVKPIALMEYLVKLVSKEGHTVLDPFMGSGSTGIACKKLGREFIGIEKESDYCKIAEARIGAVQTVQEELL